MPPPSSHPPHYPSSGYPYPPHGSQTEYPVVSQPQMTRYSSTGSDTSGSASLEFNPSAGSSSSSLAFGGGRQDGSSVSPSPYGNPLAPTHPSGTSPISYHSSAQHAPSSLPGHLQNAYLPTTQERNGSFDFTDFVVGMDAQTPPSTVTPAAYPSVGTSSTFASSALPTPSFSGGSSSTTYPLEEFDLDPKQAAIAGLPTTIAGLDLDGGRSRGIRMDDVAKEAVLGLADDDEADEDEDENGGAAGLLDV